MADRRPEDSEVPTIDSAGDGPAARSVLRPAGSGPDHDGISLRGLDSEPPLGELRSGPEKYQILGDLGEGGMGKVRAAYDRDLRRTVALKTIRSGADPRLERRFLEEAQVMGQLQHPSILPIHELGLTGGNKLYYTMPLVRGRSLRQLLDELREGDPAAARVYSLTRLMQVFLQVAQAVGYAHAKGVLHRDLKPANVMLGEHGEVQVIDWGLSQVLDRDARPEAGQVVGTPGYMSPEQARGEPTDARSDVYALGVVLYELLTLELPFRGPVGEVLAAVLSDPPLPPRARAPRRSIPLELERSCLTALAKRPEERQLSADALHAEVQSWLEAEADRARRRERADEKAAQGRELLGRYRRLQGEQAGLEAEESAQARRFRGHEPIEAKAELFAVQDRAAALRRELVRAAAEVVSTLSGALAFEAEHAGARELLADYYRDRFAEAEARGDEGERDFFRELVAAYHDGKYARELDGAGSLELDSRPAGARVRLHGLREVQLQLVPDEGRDLGTTPVRVAKLPMGSYLLVLTKEGYPSVRYPVHIARNRDWHGSVELLREEQIGRDGVYIPGGPFLQGGDPGAEGWAPPRSEPRVEGFVIARFPVTAGEYLEFLKDLARRDPEAAWRRAPRESPEAGQYVARGSDGSIVLPDIDGQGDRWDPGHPVLGISWFDAVAYLDWRSLREGRKYRLPTAAEREKAARGVDGRWFPWGWRFDPTLCNMRSSRRGKSGPAGPGEFPGDVSIYGVRGMAGNSRDWTATEVIEGEGEEARISRVLKGGAWGLTAAVCRCAHRSFSVPGTVSAFLGFRWARDVAG